MRAVRFIVPGLVPPEGFYVAPWGSPSGIGDWDDPWDWDTALIKSTTLQGQRLQPLPWPDGTTKQCTVIWFRGGAWGSPVTYGSAGVLKEPTTKGIATNPVVLRVYPGEHARPDARWATGTNDASDLVFWGFECVDTNSDLTQDLMIFDIRAARNHLINCWVHDGRGNGVGKWIQGTGGIFLYGTWLYNNGRKTSGDPYAHGLYIQNDGAQGAFTFEHGGFFNNFQFNIHGFGSQTLSNCTFKNFVMCGWGAEAAGGQGIVWKQTTMGDATFDKLLGYSGTPSTEPKAFGTFGPDAGEATGRLIIQNCRVRWSSVNFDRWQDLTIQNNNVFNLNQQRVTESGAGANPAWIYDNNAYRATTGIQSTPFRFDDSGGPNTYTFAQWKSNTGYDPNSSYTESASGRPMANVTHVFVNRCEPKGHALGTQGLIVVENWEGLASVSVDVVDILADGDSWKLYHIFDRFNATPYASGTLSGGTTINITMTTVAVPTPFTGWPGAAPDNPGTEWAAFILVREP